MDTETGQELTNKEFWSDTWQKNVPQPSVMAGLARFVRKLASRHLIRFFRRMIGMAGCVQGNVLEIGCTPGSILEKIHWACPTIKLHGIDFSQSGLQMTERRLRATGAAVTLHQGDVFEINLQTQYDLVVSVGLIEHFEDPLPMVLHHLALCKPGGHVLLCVPNIPAIPRFLLRQFDPDRLAVHNLETLELPHCEKS